MIPLKSVLFAEQIHLIGLARLSVKESFTWKVRGKFVSIVIMKFTLREKGIEMDVLTEEIEFLDEEVTEEQYVAGKPFDHTIEHSDAYYEQYIENFVPNWKRRLFYRFVKRSFDIVVSLLMLVMLSPLMLIIAIAIKCDSKGGVIFKQKRIGKKGKEFYCYKFRSMKIDAPHDCATSRLENPEQYQTRIGRFLRKTSLDELPQLWCVLVGSMSFIGYRPLCITEEKCNEMRKTLGVFSLTPGISGYAQVHGRDNVYYKNKAILDAEYVKKASLWLDLKLIFQTIGVVLKRDGNNDSNTKNDVISRGGVTLNRLLTAVYSIRGVAV